MPRKLSHYVLVIVGMGLSLMISSYLLQTLFINNNPTPFWDSFSDKVSEYKQTTLLAQSSVIHNIQLAFSSFNTVRSTPIPIAVENSPQQRSDSFNFFDTLPAPTSPLAPTDIPDNTPIPTLYIKPTIVPTSVQLPSIRPSLRPTIRPTSVPSPTKAPKPTIDVGFPKVEGDPLKQTWYGNGSLACYTTERFIQVYANGLIPDTCYTNIQAYMEANKVSMSLLGRSIQVHKKALAAFEAVSKTLDQYKVDGSTYKFPSKTYKIKNVGAYIFRCNVNASTSGKSDTCSAGCKLSPHAFGIGVDINYDENCNGCKNYDMPKEISDTFEMYGFRWGGHYPLIGSYIDPMHFEYMRDLCDGI